MIIENFDTYYKKIKILYIEDNIEIRKNIEQSIKTIYSNIVSVSSYNEAKKIFDKDYFDLIISEIKIQEEEVFYFLNEIRLKRKDFPIIILSGFSNPSYLMKALKLNIIDYLIKPIDFNDIKKCINNAIDSIITNQNLNLCIGEKIYFLQKRVLVDKTSLKEVKLTSYELKLLEFFISNLNKVVTKEQIKDSIWDNYEESTESAFKNLMSKARIKVGKEFISHLHNGYIFKI